MSLIPRISLDALFVVKRAVHAIGLFIFGYDCWRQALVQLVAHTLLVILAHLHSATEVTRTLNNLTLVQHLSNVRTELFHLATCLSSKFGRVDVVTLHLIDQLLLLCLHLDTLLQLLHIHLVSVATLILG